MDETKTFNMLRRKPIREVVEDWVRIQPTGKDLCSFLKSEFYSLDEFLNEWWVAFPYSHVGFSSLEKWKQLTVAQIKTFKSNDRI